MEPARIAVVSPARRAAESAVRSSNRLLPLAPKAAWPSIWTSTVTPSATVRFTAPGMPT